MDTQYATGDAVPLITMFSCACQATFDRVTLTTPTATQTKVNSKRLFFYFLSFSINQTGSKIVSALGRRIVLLFPEYLFAAIYRKRNQPYWAGQLLVFHYVIMFVTTAGTFLEMLGQALYQKVIDSLLEIVTDKWVCSWPDPPSESARPYTCT